ncbi:MAG: sensor histidine kinase [Chloroflexi bacterium]|nr:MAG: sensor histidine kinase [Chloroflexota bacterium]
MVQNKTKTILVVEDNELMNTAICEILAAENYSVLSASDGVDALALMRQQRPDVVLCDIMMPRMDGYTLLQHTRSDEQLRTVPFVFLTARSSTEDRRQAKRIGIDDYLIKPVDSQDLLLAMSNVLRREENALAQTERQVEKLRTQIVSSLQHEFRTPLTFILGYAELLAESPPGTVDVETLRASTSAILEGGRRLQDLIEKFLFLADMQHRRELPDSLAPIDTLSLLAAQAQTFSKQAQAASLAFTLDCAVDDPVVLGEPAYIREAVRRLIENAIQYRRADSTRIRLALSTVDGYVGLHVSDDGCGIPADKLAMLRSPFAQIDRENRVGPGIGLGLALVNQIARMHGGRLQIESEEGRGSTFTLWLPLPFEKS